jgi:biopolymer transport protein ExbB
MFETLMQTSAGHSSGIVQAAWDFLHKGGIFMIPLSFTSVVGVAAIVYKFLSLSQARVMPAELEKKVAMFADLAHSGREVSLVKEVEKGASALARLAASAIKHRGKPQSDITTAVESAARMEVARLYSGIGVLDIVITVAPLLGLLGTASGLVTIFQGLSDAADHLAIARGIAEALNTTIFGLAIAVPCVIAHGYFMRRIELLTVKLESLLADLCEACRGDSSKA